MSKRTRTNNLPLSKATEEIPYGFRSVCIVVNIVKVHQVGGNSDIR